MPLFIWSDNFSVNIIEMDQQHKKLVGFINDLHDARQANKDQEVLGKILNELVDYTKTHFKGEESLLQNYNYPDYNSQKSEHDSLVQKVLHMQKVYYSGDTNITTDIAILMNDWLVEHILVEDKKYGKFLSSKGIT